MSLKIKKNNQELSGLEWKWLVGNLNLVLFKLVGLNNEFQQAKELSLR